MSAGTDRRLQGRGGPAAGFPVGEAGFSLLEVLLAAVVLAVGVLLVSQGFALGARAAALSRQHTLATLLARSRLAELMLEEDLGVAQTEGEFEEAPLPEARWSFDVEETGTTGLLRLTVTVEWLSGGSRRRLSLSALRPEFDRLPAGAGPSLPEGGGP